jgi:hypothetical protein
MHTHANRRNIKKIRDIGRINTTSSPLVTIGNLSKIEMFSCRPGKAIKEMNFFAGPRRKHGKSQSEVNGCPSSTKFWAVTSTSAPRSSGHLEQAPSSKAKVVPLY